MRLMYRQGRWLKIFILCHPDVNGFVALQQFTIAENWSTKNQRELGCCDVPESRKHGFNAELPHTGSPARVLTYSKYWSAFSLHHVQKDRRHLFHWPLSSPHLTQPRAKQTNNSLMHIHHTLTAAYMLTHLLPE